MPGGSIPSRPVFLAMVIAVSYFTYRWIEKPGREWVRDWVHTRLGLRQWRCTPKPPARQSDMTKEQRKFRPLTLAVSVVAALSLFVAIIYGVQLALHPAAAPLPIARNGMARVGDFSLLDHEGKHHQLYRYVDSRAVVLFVYGADCNIARDSIPALKQLREQFAKHDDGFLMKV